jgi:hypothetical protein
VSVVGAGLADVNGSYILAREFAGAEMLEKESTEGGIGNIYIRRRAEGMNDEWVITLSPGADDSSKHLYKRSEVKKEQVFPPLFGWVPCTTADGVPGRRVAQLIQGLPKLEYTNAPMENAGRARGAMSPWEEWDQQQDTSSSLEVVVVGANNIPESRASEFHCTVQASGKGEIIESPAVPNSTDPVWRFKSSLKSWRHPDSLEFTLYANRTIKIGEATLHYADFHPRGFIGKLPLSLLGSDDLNATVNICVTMPGPLGPGIDVRLEKGRGEKIGIEVAIESSSSLSITRIAQGGLIARWNDDNPDKRINLRDIITEIDGTSGTPYDLLSKLAVSVEPKKIQMKVQRGLASIPQPAQDSRRRAASPVSTTSSAQNSRRRAASPVNTTGSAPADSSHVN